MVKGRNNKTLHVIAQVFFAHDGLPLKNTDVRLATGFSRQTVSRYWVEAQELANEWRRAPVTEVELRALDRVLLTRAKQGDLRAAKLLYEMRAGKKVAVDGEALEVDDVLDEKELEEALAMMRKAKQAV